MTFISPLENVSYWEKEFFRNEADIFNISWSVGVEDESGGVGITLEMFELVLFDELNVEEVVLVEHDTAEKITNSNDKNL